MQGRFFLTCFLVVLATWLLFRLIMYLAIDLIIGFAIGGVE